MVNDGSVAAPRSHAWRAARGAAQSLAGLIIGTAVLVLATPLLLEALGSDGYGIFTLALAVSGILGLLDLGTGQAVTYELSRARHDRSPADAKRIVQSAAGLSLVLGGAGSAILAVGAPTLTTWLDIDPASRDTCTAALRLAGLLLAVRLVGSPLTGMFAAHQRFGLSAIFSVAGPSLATTGALIAAFAGGSAAAATMGAVAGALLVLTIQVLSAMALFPEFGMVPSLDPPMLRRLWRFGGYASLAQVCGVLLTQLDKFLITDLVGLSAVGDYSVVYGIAFRLQIVLASLAVVVFPMVSDFARAADTRRMFELYSESFRLCSFTGILLLAPAIGLSRPFLALWISPDFAERMHAVLGILAVSSFLLGAAVVPHHLLNGRGMPHVTAITAAICLIVSIAANLLLARPFGLPGAAVAALLAMTPSLLLVWMAERSLGVRGIGLAILGRAFLLGAAGAGFGWWLGTYVTSWAALVGAAGVIMVFVALLGWVTRLVGPSDWLLLLRIASLDRTPGLREVYGHDERNPR
jgi:O-antigen/teichoic acid export membrane protein